MSGKWQHFPRSVSGDLSPPPRASRVSAGCAAGGNAQEVSEPSTRLRPGEDGQGERKRIQDGGLVMPACRNRWLTKTAFVSQGRGAGVPTSSHTRRQSVVEGHQGSGIKRTPAPIAPHPCGTWNPRCGLPREQITCWCDSQPSVRTAHSPSGTGRPKKRRPAAERQRESITCWRGPCKRRYLPRKRADVGLVNHRKNVARSANRRTS